MYTKAGEIDVEAILREHPELREAWERRPKPRPKPQPAVLVQTSERMAAAVKANPESLRLSAKDVGGVTVIEKPWHERRDRLPSDKRQYNTVEVIAVDDNGRPLRAQTKDGGLVHYEGGYQQSGARHEYNPLDALRGKDD
jgi:hypothetical protein